MNLIGAIGALNRPAQALKSSAKQESAAAEKAKPGDTAEVSGLGQLAPAPAEFGLGEARAALAALKQDIASRPRCRAWPRRPTCARRSRSCSRG